jgi:flavin reductase (DIM6/NTAB) family NADH-FMN oxidoreductase RutF
MDSVSSGDFKSAMRRFASGVTIVAASDGRERLGLTATAVCSLTSEPPQILVCVNRDAEAHDLIVRTRALGVSLLGAAHSALSSRFAGQTGVFGPARFDEGRWVTLKTGAPLLEDAVAALDCALVEEVKSSTHTIFIGRVVAVRAGDGAVLTYADGVYGTHRPLG